MNLTAQITALFSVDATQGCEPLVVQFADASTSNGTIISWDWDFDDGSIDNVPNPLHTFSGPGSSYNVCLTVMDDLAQTDTYCMMISVVDSLVLDALIINPFCFGADDGAIEISVSGGIPPYDYVWSNNATSNVLNDLFAGSYSVTVSDATNCIAFDTYELVDPDLLSSTAEVTHVSCFGGNDGAINLQITGGTPPYTYLWSSNAMTEDLFDLLPGIYTVSISDANDCQFIDIYTVSEPASIALSISITEELTCAGECIGEITVIANGGCENFTYEWNEGSTGEVIDEICEGGIYSVTVTDCNGCTEMISIEMPEAPIPIELDYVTTCATAANDGSIDLSVSGGMPPYLYFWSGGFTTEDINNLAPGDYTVQVTDANGCTVTETIPLSTLIVDMTNDTIVCEGDQLQLLVDAPDAVSFEWGPTDNLSCSDCPDPVYTADIFGPMTYVVEVVDAAGCIDQDYIVIDVQSYLDFNLLQFSNSPVFEGDTLELYCNVGNATMVEWTGPGNLNSSECNPIVPNVAGGLEGMFSVMIEDEYGCDASASVDVDILTIIDSIGEDGTICMGETYQLFVNAPNAVSIEWSPAATLDDSTIANPIAFPTEATHYTVTVEAANGDVDIASIYVGIDNVPVLSVAGLTEVCSGEDIIVCTDSGYPGTYFWTGPNGFTVTTACFNLEDFDETMAGCYQVVYTTPLGCQTTAEICINALDFQIQSITDDVDICFDESAELEVVAPGALTYQWIPEDYLDCTTCPIVNASPPQITTYMVIVTDANGCQDEAITVVNVDFECVWPGDTDTSKVVDNFDLLNIGLAYDSVGPTRDNATIFWDGQAAENWLISQPGIDVDFKHIDGNGDGMINADDTLAITQNWGEMHNFTGEDSEVNFTVDPPFYIDPDTLIEGESISLPVILGEMDDPVNDVYGIAFTLEYDSSVVVPGSAKMTFNNGWVGNNGEDMITIQKTFNSPGVIDIGMTRIDGEEMDGFGEIGQVFITIEDDILFRNGDDDSRNGDALEVIFNISNVKIINSLGEEIPVSPTETYTAVDGVVGIKSVPWSEYIQVQPNPASDAFFITSKSINIESISLFAITGELMLDEKPNGLQTQINTQNLFPGIYLLKVQTELGVMVERMVIAK